MLSLKGLSKLILYNVEGQPLDLEGLYHGASTFLCLAGPSLATLDLSLLDKRGIVISSLNNVAATNVRPHLWFTADHPKQFCDIIWKDPAIMKFVPDDNIDKSFYIRDDKNRPQC